MENLKSKIQISKDEITNIVDFAEPTFVPEYNSQHFLVKKLIKVLK